MCHRPRARRPWLRRGLEAGSRQRSRSAHWRAMRSAWVRLTSQSRTLSTITNATTAKPIRSVLTAGSDEREVLRWATGRARVPPRPVCLSSAGSASIPSTPQAEQARKRAASPSRPPGIDSSRWPPGIGPSCPWASRRTHWIGAGSSAPLARGLLGARLAGEAHALRAAGHYV